MRLEIWRRHKEEFGSGVGGCEGQWSTDGGDGEEGGKCRRKGRVAADDVDRDVRKPRKMASLSSTRRWSRASAMCVLL